MSYLFGDSTPSKLEVNYIELLRDAVEFCVQVMLADQRIAQGRSQTRTLEHATVAEVERLQKLAPLVTKAFEGTPLGGADSPTGRCAAAIGRSATEIVRAEAVRMRDALDAEIGRRDAQTAQEREGCVKALEALVVKHDLPGMVSELHLTVVGGTRYAGRARIKTGFGLDAVLDLDVPANNLFERVVRVDRLMERLDIQAPEVGGWLHKEVKRRPQHLEKHHVLEFSLGPDVATLKLRLNPDGTGPGFDVFYAREAPRVRLARSEQAEGALEQFEVDDDDMKKLLALYGKLAGPAMELAQHRKRLVEARIDGEPLRTHAKPTLLAERLITTMAPVVQEIAARSQSPGELVLRRLLSGDRREEVFLSKAELKAKLEPLQDSNRALFDPLWVSALPAPAAPVNGAVVAASAPTTVTGEIQPKAASPQAQTLRARPGTPSLGSAPLGASSVPAAQVAVSAAAAPAAAPLPGAPPPTNDALRRTLIGATVQSAAGPPADSVSKTPLADPSRMEPLRKEAAGSIAAGIIDAAKAKEAADPATKS